MKHIVVTGASSGIGFELVQQFAQNNCKVLAISRNIDSLLKLNHNNIVPISADLSDEKSLNKVADCIKKNWKQVVDVLIHNAGMLVNKPFEETTQDDFINIFQVNVFGVALLTQKLLPFLVQGSHVVMISSVGGIQGSSKFPGLAAYSASKGAVITLGELLAETYKDKGISFNTLALGAVQTKMLEEAFPGYKAPTTPLEMAAYIYNFSLTGHQVCNGKVLQVSKSTP